MLMKRYKEEPVFGIKKKVWLQESPKVISVIDYICIYLIEESGFTCDHRFLWKLERGMDQVC